MRRSRLANLVSCLAISSFLLVPAALACWGRSAPVYGVMTRDHDLLEGSDLVLNCTLKSQRLPELPRPVSADDLFFERGSLQVGPGLPLFSDFGHLTRKLDDLTIQLRVPNAKIQDSGYYFCRILVANDTARPLVCTSKVGVGYPPKHVSNFSCISINYDNLTCSWDVENSGGVLTEYKVVKYYMNFKGLEQNCPETTEKPNSCQWTTETDPKYQPFHRNISFSIKGNNSLGNSTDEFNLDEYAIVIPNSPEDLKIIELGNQSVKVGWSPPTMRNFVYTLPMKFEVWIAKIHFNPEEIKVFNAGNNASEFLIKDLIPNVLYNISIRCRSLFAKGEKMWSPVTSILVKTLPDVPYKVPQVIPEAFEYHLYEDSRSITLYWQDVPFLFRNGESFHYFITYSEASTDSNSSVSSVKSNGPSVEIRNISKVSSYSFHIHSANQEGISENFSTIFVDQQSKIPQGPRFIRAISQDLGHYNLSWSAPDVGQNATFVVFWCSSLKPWRSRCDGSVDWVVENLTQNSLILNLTDVKTNFQFAVVAKYGNVSSGMQWASCIVPHKAALGKIRHVVVEPKTSSTLKVIWNLDCSAQKAVVSRYEIIYCRINKNEECKVASVEPNAESYILRHLHPFSNYSVKIRAFNKDGVPSEDSDAVRQMTLPGAPSGPPQNVKTSPKNNSSFYVSWTPPLEPNGHITKYIVSYNESSMYLNVLSRKNHYSVVVNGLDPFSTFAVQVQACVNDSCSVKSEPVFIQTEVGVPGPMEPPRIDQLNSTHLKVSWSTPLHPNGPIDFYEVLWQEKVQNETSFTRDTVKVMLGTSVLISPKCSKLGNLGIKFLFCVRGVNIKNGTNLYGPFSGPTLTTACMMSQGLAMIIGIAIGGTLTLAILLLVIYKLIKWMKEKIHQVKSITIKLPKGLEGPETNPLNNYEYFKNGLSKNTLENERLSYIIDESEKNRHGSGSSHYSNSSTDELVFKNGKCTKFGRKPSGDSSGCSSMSSNTTPRTHLSSDSGTESDFVIPPSPDSAIGDQSLHSVHKPPLPILVEDHDQTSQAQASPKSFGNQASKLNTVDDMVLMVDQPYSKFGVSGINSLAIYSCNLANSEPSVFEKGRADSEDVLLAPYSKVGLAKSSADILGTSLFKERGYSKFGLNSSLKRLSIPPSYRNPIAMFMMASHDQKDWPTLKKFVKSRMEAKNSCEQQPLTVQSRTLGDCPYVKAGLRRLSFKKPAKPSRGYVPFSELKGMQDHKALPFPAHTNSSENSYSAETHSNEAFSDIEHPQYPFSAGGLDIACGNAPNMVFDPVFSKTNAMYPSKLSENGATDSSNLPKNGMADLSKLPKPGVTDSRNLPKNGMADLNKLPEPGVTDSSILFKNSMADPSKLAEPGVTDSSNLLTNDMAALDKLSVNHYSTPSQLSDTSNLLSNKLTESNLVCAYDSTASSQNPGTHCHLNGFLGPSQYYTQESPPTQKNSLNAPRNSSLNEVIVTPLTLRNGYVPISSLSEHMCDRTPPSSSVVPQMNGCVTRIPNGICSDGDNYITPSNKGDMRILRDDPLFKMGSVPSSKNRDALKDNKMPIQNDTQFGNGSLTYLLKPLPKMESEICEV